MRVSIENRRKQLAQCIWLRQRIDQLLSEGDDVIVLGDFNDGPGLDEYEKLFGRSSVEIVLGEGDQPRLFDPHARMVLGQRIAAAPTTARFQIPPDGQYLSALLDYIMISERLQNLSPKWHIWHPFEDPGCYRDDALREALLTASDHFPVTLDINL
jgi:endonuclease/exonuclease/phosphatase family metal-dependent hydrolase